ncbi:MAG: hypothetical protein JXQ29_11535 [Planctomycetes bacterium]|nr:hypothetical protein [Planctomycetota bacterium]
MAIRVFLLSLLAALAVLPGWAAAQTPDFVRRGLHFRAADDGVEMWIPGWVNRADKPRDGLSGEFGIKVMHLFLQMYVVVNTMGLDGIVAERHKKAGNVFKDGKLEIIERLDGCRHPTVVAIHTGIDAVEGYDNKDLIVSASDVAGKKTVSFHIVCAKGEAKTVLPVVRWLASSIRLAGEVGLTSLTDPRRLQRETGLSYRLPDGFLAARTAEGELLAATNETIDSRIALRRAEPEVADALTKKAADARAGTLHLVKMEHPDGAAVLLAFHAPAGEPVRARAEAVVTLGDGPTFAIDATGPPGQAEAVDQAVELLAAGLKLVDVEKTAAAAVEAARKLEAAIRTRNAELVRPLVDALVMGAFLAEVRAALAKALERLDEPAQVRAVEALAAAGEPAAVPALVKLYRSGPLRKRTHMRRAVLTGLRHLQNETALKFLGEEAQSQQTELAVAAVTSLGYYRTDRAEVVRRFVSLLKKEESIEHGRNPAVRERCRALRAAHEAALQRLTGRSFANARELDEWYRASKSSL